MRLTRRRTEYGRVDERREIGLQLRDELTPAPDEIGCIRYRPGAIRRTHDIRKSFPVELKPIDGVTYIRSQKGRPPEGRSIRRYLRHVSVTRPAPIYWLDHAGFIAREITRGSGTRHINISIQRIGLEDKTGIRTRPTQKT